MKEKLVEIFERTKNNCQFYEKKGKQMSLLNEIGVLRGIAYCMEEAGLCPHDDEFFRLIAIQQMLKGDEAESVV